MTSLALPPIPRVGCGALIQRGGSILLLRRLTQPEAGCWGIPGGKVDPFETVQDAVRREVCEETGLRFVGGDLLCVVDQIDQDAGDHWVAPVYLVEAFEGEARILEPTKHADLGWFELTALPQPLTAATVASARALLARQSDRKDAARA